MQREVLEFDVQFIGAGPAGLAGAIHLANLIASHDQKIAAGAPGQPFGEISGAVMDPRAIRELMPDWRERGCPVESDVTRDDVFLMWKDGQRRLPFVPP